MNTHKFDVTINSVTKTIEVDSKEKSFCLTPMQLGLQTFKKDMRIDVLPHGVKFEKWMKDYLSYKLVEDCKSLLVFYLPYADVTSLRNAHD